MRISRRITWFSTVWLFVLLVIVNSGVYFLFAHRTAETELERIMSQAETIAEAIRGDQGNAANLLAAYVPRDGMVRIIRENSSEAVTVTKYPELRAIPHSYTTGQEMEQLHDQERRMAVARFPLIWNDGSVVTLEVIEPMESYESTLATLRIVLLIASLFILLPAFLAGRALSRLLLYPIQALKETMEDIRRSGSFQRIEVPAEPKDELDQMGATFNGMIELLEKNYEKQQQFVSDASHELRTPLTVIESYARLLQRWGKKDPARLEEAIHAIAEEAERMKGLTEQMLALATGEPDRILELSRIQLQTLAEQTAKKLEQAYERKLHVRAEEECIVIGDEPRLKQLLFILCENALKYSEDDVIISLKNHPASVEMRVTDKGMGIPKKDLPHIFERFFRVDKARSRQTGGSGLGLSIAKAIVDAHKGEIGVTSEEGAGTTFTVTLPRRGEIEVKSDG